MKELWYKNAIVYSLDIETFMDSDGDGVGDFQGATRRLDYLTGMGVTCLWLLPFYPSPNRDNGYDVMDYYSVDRRLGTLGDFVEFMHHCQERGIRVIIDLVVNHTSDQHPWFQAARSNPNSKYRNYYIWQQEKPETKEEDITYPGVQDDIWTFDEEAKAYYLHHFYHHQPDLNIANPDVREEIRKIMGFWLELGVSGFRVDAAPFLIKPMGQAVSPEDLHTVLLEMREFLNERRGDAILLAEANVEPDKIPLYFGDGDIMHMLFNFLLNQHLFLALARESSIVIHESLKNLPEIPAIGQWLNFIRHHDELTLDRLPESEREEIFQAFAPDKNAQIYERGIRRRLPPMLNNDRRRIELVYSLLFTLPGTPVIRYGDEIGMGDDLSLPERESVRTVMQWAGIHNGGFSSAPTDQLTKPIISGGDYGYERVNVAAQHCDPHSLLNWMERAIRTRKQCSEFGRGDWSLLETDPPCVLAHCCTWKGNAVIAVHNLANHPCTVTLKLPHYHPDLWIEVFCNSPYEAPDRNTPSLDLSAYGYRWFRIDGFGQGIGLGV